MPGPLPWSGCQRTSCAPAFSSAITSGGTGIGFFVWDSWNALNLDRVISAILIIGAVGLLLDRGFELARKKVTYAE